MAYEFASRIRYSEVDQREVLTINALVDYFQDCSTFQTREAGAGLDYLRTNHLIWILNAWQIDIIRMPCLYEEVCVGTIPYLIKGFAGHRNFYLRAADGKICAKANSLWTLMDTEKMYPARITGEHLAKYETGEKLDMQYLDRKISLPAEGGIQCDDITVHRHHLDTNDHVNNGQYIRMTLEVVEDAMTKKGKRAADGTTIKRLRAEYKRQSHLGDVLTPVFYYYEDPAENAPFCAVDLRAKNASCCVVELS